MVEVHVNFFDHIEIAFQGDGFPLHVHYSNTFFVFKKICLCNIYWFRVRLAVVDMKGKPITLESYLDMIEKVDMDFDHFGLQIPTLVYHPSTAAALATESIGFDPGSLLKGSVRANSN